MHSSLNIAQQVQANGLPASVAAPQQIERGGLPINLYGASAQSPSIMTTLNSGGNSNYRTVMMMADADARGDGGTPRFHRVYQNRSQNTEGLVTNPAALGPTPSMIASLADTTGALSSTFQVTGPLPIADVVQSDLTL